MTQFTKLRKKSRKREKQQTINTYSSTPTVAEYFTLIIELNCLEKLKIELNY